MDAQSLSGWRGVFSAHGHKDEAGRTASDATFKLQGGQRLTNVTASRDHAPPGNTLIALFKHPKQTELAEGNAIHIIAYRNGVYSTVNDHSVEKWGYIEEGVVAFLES